MMTQEQEAQVADIQNTIVALADDKEAKQKELDEIRAELEKALRRLPVGTMFQNPANGVVYQVVEPAGTFISFRKVDYARVRKPGEKQGSLSLTAAEEAGFVLPKEIKGK